MCQVAFGKPARFAGAHSLIWDQTATNENQTRFLQSPVRGHAVWAILHPNKLETRVLLGNLIMLCAIGIVVP